MCENAYRSKNKQNQYKKKLPRETDSQTCVEKTIGKELHFRSQSEEF